MDPSLCDGLAHPVRRLPSALGTRVAICAGIDRSLHDMMAGSGLAALRQNMAEADSTVEHLLHTERNRELIDPANRHSP